MWYLEKLYYVTYKGIKILRNVDPLLGNDHEISSCTTIVTRLRPVISKRETALSMWSAPKCYKEIC
jgi:hypothetical protein